MTTAFVFLLKTNFCFDKCLTILLTCCGLVIITSLHRDPEFEPRHGHGCLYLLTHIQIHTHQSCVVPACWDKTHSIYRLHPGKLIEDERQSTWNLSITCWKLRFECSEEMCLVGSRFLVLERDQEHFICKSCYLEVVYLVTDAVYL